MTASRALAAVASVLVLVSTAAVAEEVPPDAVVATMPFIVEPGEVVLKLQTDGSPCEIDVSTGESVSTASKSAEHALNTVLQRAGGGPPTVFRTSVSGMPLSVPLPVFLPLSGRDCVGEIGGSVLRDYVLDLDFAAKVARFADPGKYAIPESTAQPDEAIASLHMRDDRPTAEIEVQGQQLQVLVNTQGVVPLLLSTAAAKKIGVDVDQLPVGGKIQGGDVRVFEGVDVSIGRLQFASIPGIVLPRGYGSLGEARDGVIGLDLISKSHVRFDYPRSRMWLRQGSQAVTFFGVDYPTARRSGVLFFPSEDRRLLVVRVFPDTPAAGLGLLVGDLFDPKAADGKRRTPTEITEAIGQGRPLRVSRKSHGTWQDVDLPSDPTQKPQTAP